MNITRNTVGWGIVGLAVVVLFIVVDGDKQRFPNMLPESELQRFANAYIVPALDGEVLKTETVVMSEVEWLMKIGAASASMSHNTPIYLYRVYGDFKRVNLFGTYGKDYQAVDVVLDGTNGAVRGASVFQAGMELPDLFEIPDARNYQLPVIPTVPPYVPGMDKPTMVPLEATEEVD